MSWSWPNQTSCAASFGNKTRPHPNFSAKQELTQTSVLVTSVKQFDTVPFLLLTLVVLLLSAKELIH